MIVNVLRLGHRRARDARITTHVCLAARAFGASGVILTGERDNELMGNVKDVVERWGGPFNVLYSKDWKSFIRDWKKRGEIIHLTMYGVPVQDVIGEISATTRDKLIIVGGPRVPGDVYKVADFNVAITNQPHSEVSALAVFLHILFDGKELEKNFDNAKLRIIPSRRGKKVEYLGDVSNVKDS